MFEVEYFYSTHSAYTYLGLAAFVKIEVAAGRSVFHEPIDLSRTM